MKSIIMLQILLFLCFFIGCAHYSTIENRSEAENIINAPIDIVWDKTLETLYAKNIIIQAIDKDNFSIQAIKGVSLLSWSDIISIRLISHGTNQTIIYFDAKAHAPQIIGWGHQKKLVIDIFNKIKAVSEMQ